MGELGVVEKPLDSNSSAFFFLLKPQLLARLASVLVAVIVCRTGWTNLFELEPPASGDVLGMWYDVVLRLLIRAFVILSDIDASGNGVLGSANGFPSPEGEDTTGCSVSAVVGAAFGIGEAVAPPVKGGTRLTENLEVLDIREAREPGRSGEGITGG